MGLFDGVKVTEDDLLDLATGQTYALCEYDPKDDVHSNSPDHITITGKETNPFGKVVKIRVRKDAIIDVPMGRCGNKRSIKVLVHGALLNFITEGLSGKVVDLTRQSVKDQKSISYMNVVAELTEQGALKRDVDSTKQIVKSTGRKIEDEDSKNE